MLARRVGRASVASKEEIDTDRHGDETHGRDDRDPDRYQVPRFHTASIISRRRAREYRDFHGTSRKSGKRVSSK
jgi:hypothetical protein